MGPTSGPTIAELRDEVFSIRLERSAAHNALDEALVEALHEALEAARRSSARVVLLSGAGKSFCAGADLASMRRQGEETPQENERLALRLGQLFQRLTELPLPVVARVHGAAIGGGLGLVAACDLAVAASNTVFALSEVRLGLVPAVICPHVLRKIGPGAASDLVLTGRRIDATEALRLGLVQRVAPEELLDSAVEEVLIDLKRGGPLALARGKRLLAEVTRRLQGSPDELTAFTAREIAAARAGEEAREGITAFLEKRPAAWARGLDAPGAQGRRQG